MLPKNYARPDLDKTRLGGLIDLIGSVEVGTDEGKAQDIPGRVYEYFLAKVCLGRRQGRRRVLHAVLCGPDTGGDDRTFSGAGL